MKNTIMTTLHRITVFSIVSICLTFACSSAMAADTINPTITETDSISVNPWQFYDQLSNIEKLIYEGFESNKAILLSGKSVDFSVPNYSDELKLNIDNCKTSVVTAMRAYLADNPAEKIWLDYCKLSIRLSDNQLIVIVTPQGGIDARNATETFEQLATEFVETLSGTDLEKLQAIHDWLSNNVEYDITANNNGNVYGAIVEGRSVCSGFAYSFKYLSDKAGLNVVYVQGYYYASTSDTYTYHAWNMAEVDGEWLLVDVTFDASLGISSLFSWQNAGVHLPDSRFTYPN